MFVAKHEESERLEATPRLPVRPVIQRGVSIVWGIRRFVLERPRVGLIDVLAVVDARANVI